MSMDQSDVLPRDDREEVGQERENVRQGYGECNRGEGDVIGRRPG
jgi:hypothetical protein